MEVISLTEEGGASSDFVVFQRVSVGARKYVGLVSFPPQHSDEVVIFEETEDEFRAITNEAEAAQVIRVFEALGD